jgi:hypothetical protein
MTRLRGPAPSLSMASSGSPSSLPSEVNGCTRSNLQPTMLECFTVATPWPTTRPSCMLVLSSIQIHFPTIRKLKLAAT